VRAKKAVRFPPVAQKNTAGLNRPCLYLKRWQNHQLFALRRPTRRASGEKTGSHGGGHTIAVSHGPPNACVCDFRPAWLSPFSQGDEFFVSPPFQTNSKAICYSVSGKKFKNVFGTGRRD
jgi:hypothetical protein